MDDRSRTAYAEEPLSPELILVSSPEVARRAREQLPEPPGGAAGLAARTPATAPGAIDRRPPPPPYPRFVTEDVPAEPPPPRHRRVGRIVLGVCALGVVAVGGYAAEGRWHGSRPTLAGAVPAASPIHVARTTPSPGTSNAVEQTHESPRPKPAVPAHATRTQPAAPAPKHAVQTTHAARTTPTTQAVQTTQTANAPAAAPAGFVPARTWVWAPRQGAGAYEVTFFLEGRVVLRARPTEARLTLPHSFRFHAGRYRWTVLPGGNVASGAPIVDSTFVVTPAAAANGS